MAEKATEMKVYANLYWAVRQIEKATNLNGVVQEEEALFIGFIGEDEERIREGVLTDSPTLKFIQTLEIEVPEEVQELIDHV